jgi:rhodanese-related sulfurtransferase
LEDVEDAVEFALESNIDALFLDGVDGLSDPGKELSQQPRFDLLPRTVLNLRRRRQEEQVTLVYAGGVRSGTDAAKLIAMGATAVVYGVAAAIAAGGILDKNSIKYGSDRSMDERTAGVTALLQANAGEASMMARCTGKTRLHNLEPEDLRVVTLSSAEMMGVPLAGTREVERSAER